MEIQMEIKKPKKCEWLKDFCNGPKEPSDLYCYVCMLNEAFRDLVAIKNSLGNAVLSIEEAFHIAGDAKDFFKVIQVANKFYLEKLREKQELDPTPIFEGILERKGDLVSYRV